MDVPSIHMCTIKHTAVGMSLLVKQFYCPLDEFEAFVLQICKLNYETYETTIVLQITHTLFSYVYFSNAKIIIENDLYLLLGDVGECVLNTKPNKIRQLDVIRVNT